MRRNRERFPRDFIFELTTEEFANLKSQFATSSWGGRRKLPLAFTEHGAIMAATVLNSPRAVEVSVYVVRAFVRLRELAVSHGDLGKRLDELEQKTEALAMQHDNFSRNTRNQLKQVFDALRALMTPPDPAQAAYWVPHAAEQGQKQIATIKAWPLTTGSSGAGPGASPTSVCAEEGSRNLQGAHYVSIPRRRTTAKKFSTALICFPLSPCLPERIELINQSHRPLVPRAVRLCKKRNQFF